MKTTFTRFPKNWIENLSSICEIALDDYLTHSAPPNIKAIVEFQNTLSQYMIEGDGISQRTHNELLSTLSGGITALSTAGVQFDDDQGLFDNDSTTKQ